MVNGDMIRDFRVHVHHLAERVSRSRLFDIVGTIGMQNSPPGAWEQAVFNRVRGGTAAELRHVLEEGNALCQAWSFRGAPVVFPSRDSNVFLDALIAEKGEEPWIYTAGLVPSLDKLGLDYATLLALVVDATGGVLQPGVTVVGKTQLDTLVAKLVEKQLPAARMAAWQSPSPYGANQTLGQAAVSFMLRPASFLGQVAFGPRRGQTPTFIHPTLPPAVDGARELVRRFVHAYGPTNRREFTKWLGSSTAQGKRLWQLIEQEVTQVNGGVMLAEDLPVLTELHSLGGVRLLGPHDPFLDANGRDLLLADKQKQRQVWRTVGNPGAVLNQGQIVGSWRQQRKQRDKLTITVTPFSPFSSDLKKEIAAEAQDYADFLQVTDHELTYN
jgi:hypothetical protein